MEKSKRNKGKINTQHDAKQQAPLKLSTKDDEEVVIRNELRTKRDTRLEDDFVVENVDKEGEHFVSDYEQEYDEDDCEIDIKAELICTLDEIKKIRMENQRLKLQLQEEKEFKAKTLSTLQEVEKIIIDLKVQVIEVKKIEFKT